MSDKKIGATAYVTVSMEICTSGSSWGHGCTIDQIHKQASDQAEGFIRQLQHDHRHEILSAKIEKVRYISSERE